MEILVTIHFCFDMCWCSVEDAMRAELPRIRRIPNLWNRYLVCSPISLPVWLASCLASLVITLAASLCQLPSSTSTTTGKNLMCVTTVTMNPMQC